jgi:RNA polymerase sigma-70 factor (ECF subfamily)
MAAFPQPAPAFGADPPHSGVQLCYPRRMAEADPLADVAEAAGKGDAGATRALLGAIGKPMLKVVRMVLGKSDRDIEDVLQDAFVGVVQGLAGFRGESTVLHFARTIALRRALDHKRSRGRRAQTVEIESAELLDPASGPKGTLVAAARRDAFRELMETLSPEQAEAFAHRVLFGFSVEEIAIEMRVPIETVRSRLRLAKSALRARIQQDATLLELSEISDDDAP